MKILFINNYLHPDYVGGAEESSRILVNQLAIENDVYTISFYKKNEIKRNKQNINIYLKRPKYLQLKFIEHLTNQGNVFLAIKIKKIVNRINPDVIHFNNIQGYPAYLIKQLGDYKIVHTLRDYNTLCFRNSLFKNGTICDQCNICKLQSKYKIWAYSGIDGIVSNSELTLKIHNDYGYEKKEQSVIYAGYNDVNINTTKNNVEKFRVGFIGKINYSKGAGLLNEISKGYKEVFRNQKLIVAGTGDNEIIRNFELANIEFIGYSNPTDFYDRVDAIIIPSLWYDPLPRIIYESISNSVIPILSKYSGGQEVVSQVSEKLIFDPNNNEDIRRLFNFLNDPEILIELRNKIDGIIKSGEYDSELTKENYISFYKKVQNIE